MQVIIKSFGIFLSWVSSGFLIYFFVTLSGSTDVRLNWYFVAIVLFIMFVVQTIFVYRDQRKHNGNKI
ncbi:hypothetical protein B8W93_11575 [Lentilactobacillus kefiri]|uniref:Uncharacterized protein n=1 Tax=Lentilactobacillus kefiri TaxID=33962 RepID=A0A511DYK0_LENKE|nr:hypothetical protein B9K02_09745 [Lentilactobacillus kefiri]PAK80496.1 hypothetical protein B8W85_11755 [Lentilactobacillus kefiri]PAL05126.1 hypothetical protein B8W93_11575 [Lentilactobacillus kefiri]QGV24923.1 hypothetical protein DNL43_06445 [Lentilactobacillus kefiri]GEL29193.1 hypothetical protein LKE01_20130 [Lentilactobacillus kefiri]